ncbi:hypothetical protein MLD38_002119 [Melastoma candidum]|uniref:Uncharacterized protein n=1 Tax=Melastoma candidum TaxID=119954 RepID=A0ACB9SEW2_9MYRT|nr:hypothetical protein MLD38_002119 [Melastoma candidum]
MDDGGHRDNGRHKGEPYKTAHGQHQPSMKQIMAIMAERDQAIQERNQALSEKKAAIAERDMAFHQRDMAIAERNNAMLERDNAIASLQYRENSLATGNASPCPPGCQISRGSKQMHHHPQQHVHHVSTMNEGAYNSREMHPSESIPLLPIASETVKARPAKRPKEAKGAAAPKKLPKQSKKVKRENDDLNKILNGGDSFAKPVKSNWKVQDLGLNQVAFDETTMLPPMCTCTGIPRQCYKWGSGGWQSSCCTTTISMYPLPTVPNKRHSRVGGRKMSGGAFSKLLSRLAAEGQDLSNPVDLRDHWAKHGTNRYITIK